MRPAVGRSEANDLAVPLSFAATLFIACHRTVVVSSWTNDRTPRISPGRTMRGANVSEAVTLGRVARPDGGTLARIAVWPRLAPYFLLAPSAVFLIAFTYWPVLLVVANSFTVHGFGTAAAPGLSNYTRLFADPHFHRAVLNNLLYAAGTIVPSLALALGLAVALRDSTAFAVVLRTVIALPLLIPLVAAASLFIFIFLPGARTAGSLSGAALGALERDQLARRSVARAGLDHRHHGMEKHRLLHAVFPGGPCRHSGGADRRGEDRRRRRGAAFLACHLAASGPYPGIRADHRAVERADPGRSRHRR